MPLDLLQLTRQAFFFECSVLLDQLQIIIIYNQMFQILGLVFWSLLFPYVKENHSSYIMLHLD